MNLCKNTKALHLLNSKKTTKRFCELTRSLNKDASLTHIKKLDVNGEYRDYNNNDELNTDLVDFYKDIYCKIPNKTLNLNNFLPEYILLTSQKYKLKSSMSKNTTSSIYLFCCMNSLRHSNKQKTIQAQGLTGLPTLP